MKGERDMFDLLFPLMKDDIWKVTTSYEPSKCFANVKNEDNAYIIELALPGFKEDDVRITLKDDILTVNANSKTEVKEDTYITKEIEKVSIKRSFNFSKIEYDKENIKAKLEDGLMTITIPKKDIQTEDEILIKINE